MKHDFSKYSRIHILVVTAIDTNVRCVTLDLTQGDIATTPRFFYAGAILGASSYFSAQIKISKASANLVNVVFNGTSYTSSAKIVVRGEIL